MSPHHAFTTNPAERQLLIRRGYQDETGSSAPIYVFDRAVLHAGVHTVPLRRLFNPSTGDRFHPADPDEAFAAIRDRGYVDETRLDSVWALPVSQVKPPGSARLHQFWSPANRDHFLTTNPDEAKPGYRPEPPQQELEVLKLPEMAEGIVAVRLFRLFRS